MQKQWEQEQRNKDDELMKWEVEAEHLQHELAEQVPLMKAQKVRLKEKNEQLEKTHQEDTRKLQRQEADANERLKEVHGQLAQSEKARRNLERRLMEIEKHQLEDDTDSKKRTE